ncbi:winged helix-turn-helix transcriptional regulator [Saccharospirillum alexandrii]|uniref:winged helix-turn-helix transcriptional regulator n=1 Tax=Saccharospirillum alexandrii TaxID=2448477 RepID=UPI000FD6EFA1|nr:helix-turn-helix domain-containing protein [Saccharospirillum alexandrii]
MSTDNHEGINCPSEYLLALRDTMAVVNGKWKLLIVCSLFEEAKRFSEIGQMIDISPRMLSKELKELELNGVVEKHIVSTTPVRIEYELTVSGKALGPLMEKMVEWGLSHRKALNEQSRQTKKIA